MLGKLDIHMHKNATGPLSYTINKIKLKYIKYLNVRPETKTPRRIHRKSSLTLALAMIFWDIIPKAQEQQLKHTSGTTFKNVLLIQGNHQQTEKTTHRLGENICKT